VIRIAALFTAQIAVNKRLAERLTVELAAVFAVTNLKLMRQFYVLNAERIGQTASGLFEISKGGIAKWACSPMNTGASSY
jgi:hypothetical protein